MTLGEHLDELRVRLMRATLAFVIAFVTLYAFREPVNDFIHMPYEQAWERLHEGLVEVRREQVEEDPRGSRSSSSWAIPSGSCATPTRSSRRRRPSSLAARSS